MNGAPGQNANNLPADLFQGGQRPQGNPPPNPNPRPIDQEEEPNPYKRPRPTDSPNNQNRNQIAPGNNPPTGNNLLPGSNPLQMDPLGNNPQQNNQNNLGNITFGDPNAQLADN